jgi:peptidoglycan/LPS O-acetylase OafA/YrhL
MASSPQIAVPEITPQTSTRLPGLDGLRAFAVVRVIVHHYIGVIPISFARYDIAPILAAIMTNAHFGADIFFVLSGFLITWLLLKEERKTGTLNIRRFYVQRAIRILPPYLFCIIVLAALGLAGVVALGPNDVVSSLLFFRNCASAGTTFTTSHFWSLAIEEQFYLLWPITLLWIRSPRSRSRLICSLIAAAPVWREATYLMMGPSEFMIIRSDFHCDPLLFGCALALIRSNPAGLARLKSSMLQSPIALCVAAIVLAAVLARPADHALVRHFWFFRLTFESLAIAIVVNYVVEHRDDPLGKILNSRIVVWIGKISFSLYLWQQSAFTFAPNGHTPWAPFPIAAAAAIAMTMVSYNFIEKPCNRLRGFIKSQALGA